MGSKSKNKKRNTKVTGNNAKHEKSKDKKACDNIPAAGQSHEKSDDIGIKDQTNQRSYLRSGLNWIINLTSYLRIGLNWIVFVIVLPFNIILKVLIWIFDQVIWLLNSIQGVLQRISGNKTVQSKDEEIKTKLDEFKDTIALLETEKHDALKLVEELRVKISILETEKGDALTLFEGSKVTLNNVEIEKVNTTIELKKFKDNVTILTKEKEDGLISLQKCKKVLQNVESEKKNALASLEKFKDTTAKLEKENEDTLQRLQQITKTLQNVELEKKNALESLESLKVTTSKLEKEKEDALTRCEKFKQTMAILEKEKDEALTRLSELMGNKLRENNPAITNLNDPNRPMKLGEQFGELYENEWTDAFSEISETKELNLNEFKTIDILLNILKEINQVCRDDVSNHITEKSLKDKADTKHEVSLKDVKENLKSNAASYIRLLCKKITEDESTCKFVFQYKDYSLPYIEQCVKISYFAVLQDPPMYINFEPAKIYDKHAFKEYTKSGSEIDFLVWPALHLHQSGPILCKGVVQPKE